MGVKPSEVINNGPQMKLRIPWRWVLHPHFAKYTPTFVFLADFSLKHPGTLRIPRWWMLNILKWSNESRMPTNNGPQTKLGYDTILLVNSYRKIVMPPKASGASLQGGRSNRKDFKLALPEPSPKRVLPSKIGSSTQAGSSTQKSKQQDGSFT